MRFCAMMAGPVFFSITMFLLHPEGGRIILTGFVLTTVVMAFLNKLLP